MIFLNGMTYVVKRSNTIFLAVCRMRRYKRGLEPPNAVAARFRNRQRAALNARGGTENGLPYEMEPIPDPVHIKVWLEPPRGYVGGQRIDLGWHEDSVLSRGLDVPVPVEFNAERYGTSAIIEGKRRTVFEPSDDFIVQGRSGSFHLDLIVPSSTAPVTMARGVGAPIQGREFSVKGMPMGNLWVMGSGVLRTAKRFCQMGSSSGCHFCARTLEQTAVVWRQNIILPNHSDPLSTYVCVECIPRRLRGCPVGCGRMLADGAKCPECNRKFRVSGHGFMPELVFDGADSPDLPKLHFGVELETQPARRSAGTADDVCELFEKIDPEVKTFWLQRDGSIDCSNGAGVEICSHPRTEKALIENIPWQDMMAGMRKLGYRSHDGGMCGLHVHMSRANLSLANGVNMAYLIDANWEDFVRFSRRASEQTDQWSTRSPAWQDASARNPNAYRMYIDRFIHGNDSRYRAVNFTRTETIELRLMRGTLKWSTFLATMELVRTLVRIAKRPLEDSKAMTMEDIVKEGRGLGFAALDEYWASRKGRSIPERVRVMAGDRESDTDPYDFDDESDDESDDELL